MSPLSEYVLQTKLPRGWKVPKFNKFTGDTNESTIEHIARYLNEAWKFSTYWLQMISSLRKPIPST